MPLRRRALLHQAMAAVLVACPAIAPAAAKTRRRAPLHAGPPLVVIDPGHGGKDPGCIGLGGTQEKIVVLALGRALRRQLQTDGRYRVAMTRDSDVFIPLEQRVAFAQQQRAMLFISLHANAAADPGVRGACVYRFATRASDAAAAAMARFENSADRYGGPAFRDASPVLTHILASLMRRETWRHAAELQNCLVDRLDDRVNMVPVAARHARFVVLSAPDIPSVLIESGFLTNHTDERLLCSDAYRRVLAGVMRLAVDGYFVAIGE